MWKASAILEELAKQNPGLFRSLKRIHTLWQSGNSQGKVSKLYKQLEAVSIDHGVMEHSSRATVIPVHFEWSDVGSWSSLPEVGECNEDGNVMYGNIVDLGSTNSVLFVKGYREAQPRDDHTLVGQSRQRSPGHRLPANGFEQKAAEGE